MHAPKIRVTVSEDAPQGFTHNAQVWRWHERGPQGPGYYYAGEGRFLPDMAACREYALGLGGYVER